MTTNPNCPHLVATLVDDDNVWLGLYRDPSHHEVYITVADDTAAIRFYLSRSDLVQFITVLKRENELLRAQ